MSDTKKKGQVPDIAEQRREQKGGQLKNNPEQPAEEGARVPAKKDSERVRKPLVPKKPPL